MFVPSKEPIPLSEACLLGLCPSLNAPVVRNDELPSGPARAAIVTFAEEYGDLGLAVAIRALESGKVVVYRTRESLGDTAEVARAMDAALTFAERLGFLFDDDMIDTRSGSGRSEALDHWNRLTGEGEVFTAGSVVEPPAPPIADITLPGEGLDGPMEDLLAPGEVSGAAAAADPAEESSAMLLDDLMELADSEPGDELILEGESLSGLLGEPDLEIDSAIVSHAPPAPSSTTTAPPAAAGAVPLSKFRRAGRDAEGAAHGPTPARSTPRTRPASPELAEATEPDLGEALAIAEAETDENPGPAALGRIPIVRRRRPESDTGRPSLLTRILSSF